MNFDKLTLNNECEMNLGDDVWDFSHIPNSSFLFRDNTDPMYQVQAVVDSGGNLDDYHWEKKLWNVHGHYMGSVLVLNKED